jgi:hypothetical protein
MPLLLNFKLVTHPERLYFDRCLFCHVCFNNEHIALMVNMTSVVSSAFTTIPVLVFVDDFEKLISRIAAPNQKDKTVELTTSNAIVILGSSFVGSLAFTYSDSFWFNAVEAEVYAMASLFISLLFFWLGLRWEQDMDSLEETDGY